MSLQHQCPKMTGDATLTDRDGISFSLPLTTARVAFYTSPTSGYAFQLTETLSAIARIGFPDPSTVASSHFPCFCGSQSAIAACLEVLTQTLRLCHASPL
jgi:hypothetical protein